MAREVYDWVLIQLARYYEFIIRNNESDIYMTEDESYWCNTFDGLAWQVYAKPRPESTRLLNLMNCAEMATDLEYIRTVLGIRYK